MRDQDFEPQGYSGRRATVLFDELHLRIFEQTDRLFAGLMVVQWIGGMSPRFVCRPRPRPVARLDQHSRLAAIFVGGTLAVLPIGMVLMYPGQAATATQSPSARCCLRPC